MESNAQSSTASSPALSPTSQSQSLSNTSSVARVVTQTQSSSNASSSIGSFPSSAVNQSQPTASNTQNDQEVNDADVVNALQELTIAKARDKTNALEIHEKKKELQRILSILVGQLPIKIMQTDLLEVIPTQTRVELEITNVSPEEKQKESSERIQQIAKEWIEQANKHVQNIITIQQALVDKQTRQAIAKQIAVPNAQLSRRLADYTLENMIDAYNNKNTVFTREYLNGLILEILRNVRSDALNHAENFYATAPIAACNEIEIIRQLLETFYQKIQSEITLNPHSLRGLALSIRYLGKLEEKVEEKVKDRNSLVKALSIIFARLSNFHRQRETSQKLQLILVVIIDILNALIDQGIESLDDEESFNLYKLLDDLETYDNADIAFLKAYAAQALARLPGDKSFFTKYFGSALDIVQGVSSVISAAQDFNVIDVIVALKDTVEAAVNIADEVARGWKKPWYRNLRVIEKILHADSAKTDITRLQNVLELLVHNEFMYEFIAISSTNITDNPKCFAYGMVKSLGPLLLEGIPVIRFTVLALLRKIVGLTEATVLKPGYFAFICGAFEVTASSVEWPQFKIVQEKTLELLQTRGEKITELRSNNNDDELLVKEQEFLQICINELSAKLQPVTKLSLSNRSTPKQTKMASPASSTSNTVSSSAVTSLPLSNNNNNKSSSASSPAVSIESVEKINPELVEKNKRDLFEQAYQNKYDLDYQIDKMWSSIEDDFNKGELAKALNYYVKLECVKSIEEVDKDKPASLDLLTEINKILSAGKGEVDEKQLILLQGKPGSGKSLFCQHLVKTLWDEYKQNNIHIPILINLSQIRDPSQEFVKQALNEWFTGDQIKKLKDDEEKKYLFIIDGYDEVTNCNISNLFEELSKWKNADVIISSRIGSNDELIKIIKGREHGYKYQGLYIAPFNDDQINEYLLNIQVTRLSLAKNNPQVTEKAKILREEIEGLEGEIKNLIKTPFILKILVDEDNGTLMQLQQLREEKVEINGALIYKIFVEQWYKEHEKKLRATNYEIKKGTLIRNTIENYAMDIALEMFLQGEAAAPITPVEYRMRRDVEEDNWLVFFKDELLPNTGREHGPFIKKGNSLEFIHKSLQEYYVACAMLYEVYPKLKLNAKLGINSKLWDRQQDYFILKFLKELIQNDKAKKNMKKIC